jgi:hypothetical protein
MKTKECYISAVLVVAFIVPMWSVVYGRFEPKEPPITDPYNPEPYMLELAEQLEPEQAEILLRGIRIPSTRAPKRERRVIVMPPPRPLPRIDRPLTVMPRPRPVPREDRVATVVRRPAPAVRRDRTDTVPKASKTYPRIRTPWSRKAKPKSTDRRVIYQPADSTKEAKPESIDRRIAYQAPDRGKIVQVYRSDIPEDELSEALKKGDLCLVRLSDDPRIYAIRAPKSAYEPTYCTPVVADTTGRKYLLFSTSDITLTELVQALGRHPSDFSLIKEYDPCHPMSKGTSVCSVISDKLGQLLDFLASGFERDQQEDCPDSR